MKKTLLLISVVFASACGGKSDHETMDPCKDMKMAHMDCAGMADNVSKSMEASGMPADAVAPMKDMFTSECTNQAWSQETIDCMAAASDETAGEACMKDTMSSDQQASLNAQFDALEHHGDGEDMPEDDGGGEEGMD